jgi:hypothetical protein
MKNLMKKSVKFSDSTKIMSTAIIIFVSVFTYRNFISDDDYSIQKFITFKDNSIGGLTFQNNTDDTDKLKDLAIAITGECNKEEFCEKENLYKFVARIPYYTSDKPTKKPIEVIATNSGDCDEKSFLFATLLQEKNYKSLLVFAKKEGIYHTFVCIPIDKNRKLREPYAFLEIEEKKYYYVETTWDKAYIGQFNGYEKKDIVGVYNVADKTKIALSKIELVKNL